MIVFVTWATIIAAVLLFFFWATRLLRKSNDEDRFDAGLAILEFGKAYPNEAIRQVQMSVDGEMVFLRLWTGRIGCMRRNGARFLCHLIDPGKVGVTSSENGMGLVIDFPGLKAFSGEFEFASQKEAAEVSLWILGSFSSTMEQDQNLPNHA